MRAHRNCSPALDARMILEVLRFRAGRRTPGTTLRMTGFFDGTRNLYAAVSSVLGVIGGFAFLLGMGTGLFAAEGVASAATRLVGVAAVDVTPDYPVRLSGYGSRREETAVVVQRLSAKALAIGSDEEGPAVLVTVDNMGVPYTIRNEVLRRLAGKTNVVSDRFAISFSHTHCAPMLTGVGANLFSMDIPAEHLKAIDRYTHELTDKIEQVVLAALADRKPARLAWGKGEVGFAANRRNFPIKRIDHDLPVLCVTAPDGKVRAIFTSYACHCTTIAFNIFHSDWAGAAQQDLERDFPGAIALTAIGCGADQNPAPRGTLELAAQHGEELADEARRVLGGKLTPITGALICRTKQITLPFEPLPTHEQWQTLAESPIASIAYHARKNLERLDRGETLPTQLPYMVQTWTFGNDLAMVFLPGEVVVDYSLRLKSEFDRTRLWVNAYSNDAPCYIPSERVLEEGGYEGGGAMVYYDRPTRFASGIEDRIISAVHDILPKSFAIAPEDQPLFVAKPLTAEGSFTDGVEGPACDAAGNIYAVNFAREQTIGKISPDGKAEVFVSLPGESDGNGIRFTRDGTMFVADYTQHNVLRVDMKTKAVSIFAHEDSMFQPNDLALAPNGSLYLSDPDWEWDEAGHVWRVDSQGKVTKVTENMGTPNGIEVSPDGRTLYVNESIARCLWAFTILPDGSLTQKRLLVKFPDFSCDGMRCDVDGNLYMTRPGKGVVVKLSPTGKVLREIPILGDSPTNICFGGSDGRTAYVTEADRMRVVQFRVDRPGLEWQRAHQK
jgi:sugar lactone lactonase YvrE